MISLDELIELVSARTGRDVEEVERHNRELAFFDVDYNLIAYLSRNGQLHIM